MNANGADANTDANTDPVTLGGAAGPDGEGDEVAAAGRRMAALAGLGRPEDFVAIYAVLRAGRLTRDRLVELLRARDAGYDPFSFAGVLAELPHIGDEEFAAAGLDDLEIAIMRACFADWYRALISSGIP